VSHEVLVGVIVNSFQVLGHPMLEEQKQKRKWKIGVAAVHNV